MKDEKVAPKDDQDNYEKVDYSLVPWGLLSGKYLMDREPIMHLQREIHLWLNSESDLTINGILALGLRCIDVKYLAVSLGYGCEKYYRDSWRERFGGDYKRILRAALRHGHKYLCGEDFDGEAIEGYEKGNTHLGAILWCLMVAECEVVACR